MTWQLHHNFVQGACILGAQLATCEHCGTLRVDAVDRKTVFIRRAAEESDRVRELEPPCLSPAPFVAPW